MEKDLKKLIDAMLKWSAMPPEGDSDWNSDFEFAAEEVVPLAAELREKYFPVKD